MPSIPISDIFRRHLRMNTSPETKKDKNLPCKDCPVAPSKWALLHDECALTKQFNLRRPPHLQARVQWRSPTEAYLGQLSLSALRCKRCQLSAEEASKIIAKAVEEFLGVPSAPCSSSPMGMTHSHGIVERRVFYLPSSLAEEKEREEKRREQQEKLVAELCRRAEVSLRRLLARLKLETQERDLRQRREQEKERKEAQMHRHGMSH